MKELLRTTNLVELSWTEAVLRDAGIDCLVLDTHMSVLEGSLAIIPRRLMVADDDLSRARRILADSAHDMAPGADGDPGPQPD
jgi:hypothetical protein